uniref:Uncharacterized protein n=1 Tax=Phasianus colchicus TaxID=9054 RepID=A0A669NVE8_PHACC
SSFLALRAQVASLVFAGVRCLVSHGILVQALVHFLAIPKMLIVKLSEAEDSHESSFGHLVAYFFSIVVNSGLTTGEL